MSSDEKEGERERRQGRGDSGEEVRKRGGDGERKRDAAPCSVDGLVTEMGGQDKASIGSA